MGYRSDRPGLSRDELRRRALALPTAPSLPAPLAADEQHNADHRPYVLALDALEVNAG